MSQGLGTDHVLSGDYSVAFEPFVEFGFVDVKPATNF